MNVKSKIPITVISGHLGSGKTTLIQRFLSTFPKKKFLVIENEFGEVGIDGEVLSSNDNALIEINNGCICCNIQSELNGFLEKIIQDSQDIEHILIEATGVANPAKIIYPLVADHYLKEYFELISVVCVIDGVHYDKHSKLDEFGIQVLTSDSFYISKVDDADEIKNVVTDLSIDSNRVVNGIDLKEWLFDKRFNDFDENLSKGSHHHHHYQKFSFTFEGEFDPMKIERYLNVLFARYSGKIYRSKGLLYFYKNPYPFIFQGVFNSLDFIEHKINESVPKQNRVTLIGEGFNGETIEQEFKSCLMMQC